MLMQLALTLPDLTTVLATLDTLVTGSTALMMTNAPPELIAVTLKLTAPTLMVHTHAPVKLDTQEMESTTALTLMNVPLLLMAVLTMPPALTMKEVTLALVTMDSSVMEQPPASLPNQSTTVTEPESLSTQPQHQLMLSFSKPVKTF